MKRHEHVWRRNRFWILGILLGIEAMVGLRVWSTTKPSALMGFLTKSGSQYLVVWRDEDAQLQYQALASLDGAIQFAQDDLRLAAGRNLRTDLEVERVWVDDRFGGYVLLWKTE